MATQSGACNETGSTSDDRYYIFSFSYGILAVSRALLNGVRILCNTSLLHIRVKGVITNARYRPPLVAAKKVKAKPDNDC